MFFAMRSETFPCRDLDCFASQSGSEMPRPQRRRVAMESSADRTQPRKRQLPWSAPASIHPRTIFDVLGPQNSRQRTVTRLLSAGNAACQNGVYESLDDNDQR